MQRLCQKPTVKLHVRRNLCAESPHEDSFKPSWKILGMRQSVSHTVIKLLNKSHLLLTRIDSCIWGLLRPSGSILQWFLTFNADNHSSNKGKSLNWIFYLYLQNCSPSEVLPFFSHRNLYLLLLFNCLVCMSRTEKWNFHKIHRTLMAEKLAMA